MLLSFNPLEIRFVKRFFKYIIPKQGDDIEGYIDWKPWHMLLIFGVYIWALPVKSVPGKRFLL